MTCPTCHTKTKIIDSRPQGPGRTYRRHRCKNGHAFSTLETFEKFLEQRICADTGLRKYSLMRAAQLTGDVHKCDHCGKWHLTQQEKTGKANK